MPDDGESSTGRQDSTQSLGSVNEVDVFNVTLEQLLDYLLATKRSLAATDHVWRANQLVHAAREAFVEVIELRARSIFVADGITSQLKILQDIKSGIEQVAWRGRTEFETTIRDLDHVDSQLQAIVDRLKSTVIESSLRPAGDAPRTLHNFVDENNVERLKAEVRDSIDRTQEAHYELVKTLQQFDEDVEAIKKCLKVQSDSTLGLKKLEPSIPSVLRSLESQAQEMAKLLESLVQHFDLCVTALKHTEGGGAAAQKITDDLPVDISIGRSRRTPPLEPISEEDRHEMLSVLIKDAAELEDVVMEIRDRLTEMESQSEDLTSYLTQLKAAEAHASTTFHRLGDVGARLLEYAQQARDFQKRWGDQRQGIFDRMDEMEALRDFYGRFAAAYDGLLVEVGRRREMQNRMEKAARNATREMDRIYQDDEAERDAFRQDQGNFLPSDIWIGLMDPPARFKITRVGSEIESIPDLPRAVLEQAARRRTRKL